MADEPFDAVELVCGGDFCDANAVVFMCGPTAGQSPRVTFIAGRRAAELATLGDLAEPVQLRCVDCAIAALERLAGTQQQKEEATRVPARFGRCRVTAAAPTLLPSDASPGGKPDPTSGDPAPTLRRQW